MNLRAEQISKQYFRRTGEANNFYAVHEVSLEMKAGTVTVLCGRSGSGKTTLLNMLSGLLRPTAGKVWLDGTELFSLPDRQLSELRSRSIGVIPQGRSMLDTLTVEENILLQREFYNAGDFREEAAKWMERLHIENLAKARASELSGGEQRRAAIARTMTAGTQVILTDEPTGDLDDENTGLVFACFREAADLGCAVLIVSHETDALQIADFAYRMDAGTLAAISL